MSALLRIESKLDEQEMRRKAFWKATNNFGPMQYPEKIIPLFITNILEGKKIPLYGDGLNTRDWLYVEDNCRAIDIVLHEGRAGQIYNIGSNEERSNLDITMAILKELGGGEKSIEYVKDRPGHDQRYSLDCKKIKEELGWGPKHDFQKAFKDTIAWYKNNEPWYKKIKTGEYKNYYKTQYTSP